MAVPDLRSNSYYMNKLSASAQTNGRPHYDELARSCIPPAIVGDHSFADQQRLYYRQPYSVAMNSLNPPIPFPNHPPVDEPILPKFPPQMFDIPDIHDSNSVFNEGTFDVTGGGGGVSKPVTHHLPFESSVASPLPLQPPVCRTLMPFVGDWQPPSYISAAAAAAAAAASSTNSSSPLTHNEENKSYDVPMSQPLTQQQNVFSSSTVKAPVKKTKSPKKRKRKDPNEPQKPVSAYSLFFRNAQAAIKSQNPNATFGDISKIVASMWDNLDNEIKRFYKRQMETAKKEYLKQLAVYRASLTTQQESEGRSASGREESDQAQQQQQQQTALAKASSSSSSSSSGPSSVSSSLLASHADESISQGPSVSEVQTPDHSAIQLHQRPPSVETAVHKLPISQHAMNQQQQSHQVYFKELVPTAGPSPLQNGVYGVQGNVPPPAMSQNMFLSYNTERPDYFGSGIGIVQNHYADSRYAAAGLWSHSSQSEDYTPKCRGWPPWPK